MTVVGKRKDARDITYKTRMTVFFMDNIRNQQTTCYLLASTAGRSGMRC